MRRMFYLSAIGLLLAGLCAAARGLENPQPVYIYLLSRMGDHVNIEMTEDRLRRILPMLERQHALHPELGVSGTILLSGAVSQALLDRNPKNGIKDFVLDYVRRGVVELGYDGTDEPTYQRRSMPQLDLLKTKNPEERWLVRSAAAEKFLTEARDIAGMVQPGRTGGLKKMQEVFGEAACITGVTHELGGDSEYVHQIGRFNNRAIMFGMPDPDPARNIHGYRGSTETVGRMLGTVPNSSPELLWQDHILRSSETTDAAIRVVYGYEGPDAIKAILDKIDRSHVRVIHVEIGRPSMYLQPPYQNGSLYPPIRLAYEHPDRPKLPFTFLRGPDEIQATYEKEEAMVNWLLGSYFPANPGSRFVSSADLKQMTPPSAGYSISLDNLTKDLNRMLRLWGSGTYPPSFAEVDGRYLSLADLFQVMTSALSEMHQTGKRPQSVRLAKVYGPLEVTGGHGPNVGTVTAASVAKACATLADRLNDPAWKPLPNNIIPAGMTVEGIQMNAAQFLRLMAEALVAPSPETKLNVKMTYMYSEMSMVYPRSRPPVDQGATWTFKPAPMGPPAGQLSVSRLPGN